MRCLGVAFNSPGTIVSFLTAAGFNAGGIEVLGPTSRLKSSTKNGTILIQDVRQYSRHVSALSQPAYANKLVIVFGSSLSLSAIKGYIPLDHKLVEGTRCCESVPIRLTAQRLRKAAAKPAISAEPPVACDHLHNMVESVKKDSLLNPLMSYIYTLPSRTHQTPVKELCAKTLTTGQGFQDLSRKLQRAGLQLSTASSGRLRAIIEGPVAQRYISFFRAYNGTHSLSAFGDLCATHQVSQYEVRYLLSVVGDSLASAKKR